MSGALIAVFKDQRSFAGPFDVEYIVQSGGGGGGGGFYGGGAGAGGMLEDTVTDVEAGDAWTVAVAGGGAGGVHYSDPGQYYGYNGGNSAISGDLSVSTLGGGGGGSWKSPRSVNGPGRNGGCGGGSNYAETAGLGTAGPPRQGYDGGTASPPADVANGGGGTAAVGGSMDNPTGTGGTGGAGTQWVDTNYYGGGGGGSGQVDGPGGIGGGGVGESDGDSNGGNGTTNSGGGGGGMKSGSGYTGGTGGSGVVIMRYPDSNATAASTSGATYSNPTGYHVYTFTGSGSITF